MTVLIFAGMFISLSIYLLRGSVPPILGEPSFLSNITTWVLAYLIFIAGFMFRDRTFPFLFVYLGKISYSLYLLHILVMTIVPRIGSPVQVSLTWFALSVLVSMATYHGIEKPCIALGHRITRHSEQKGFDARAHTGPDDSTPVLPTPERTGGTDESRHILPVDAS